MPEFARPTVADTDELLAELAVMPRCPEVLAVEDMLLDYRLEVAR